MIAITVLSIVNAMSSESNEEAIFNQVSSILTDIQSKGTPESTYNEIDDVDEMFGALYDLGPDLAVGIDHDNDIVYAPASNPHSPFYDIDVISYEEFLEQYAK